MIADCCLNVDTHTHTHTQHKEQDNCNKQDKVHTSINKLKLVVWTSVDGLIAFDGNSMLSNKASYFMYVVNIQNCFMFSFLCC